MWPSRTVLVGAFALLTVLSEVSSRSVELVALGLGGDLVADWEHAYRHCAAQGAEMAAPVSGALRDDLVAQILAFFLKMKAVHSADLQFISAEGIPLHNMSDMMNKLQPQHGDCISLDKDRLRVAPCSAPFPYICYKPSESVETTTPELVTSTTEEPVATTSYESDELLTTSVAPDTSCGLDSGYEFEESTRSCYKYHDTKVTWQEARDACVAEGSDLAVLDDDSEARLIHDKQLSTSQYGITIGLRYYNANSTWTAVDGRDLSEIYHTWKDTNWLPHASQYSCGVIHPKGTLDHWMCTETLSFLCEKKLSL